MTFTHVRRWLHPRFKDMHSTRLATLSALVFGFLRSARLGIAAIAEGIVGETLTRHKRKRVDRFLGNVGFDTLEVMKMLALEAWRYIGRLTIAVDWVELRNNFTAIVATATTGKGRALPVAWSVEQRSKLHRSQNSLEEGFMRLIAALLPDPRWITVVCDRGFGRAMLLPAIEAMGMNYVIRVRGHVQIASGSYRGLLENFPLKEGETADLGPVDYREDGVTSTRLVAHWARGAEEPLYLATNLTNTPKRIVRIYSQRMQEEESFRDMKSHRYGFALRYPKLTKGERYERLFVIWAVGVWLFFAQGAAAVSLQLHLGLSTATNGRRDLSIVRIGVILIARPIRSIPALMAMMSEFVREKRWG
jgi:hypothetical protein